MAELQQLEQLTEQMYTGATNELRREAFDQIQCLQVSLEYVPQCRFMLENSESQYTLLFAANSLTELVTKHWNAFNVNGQPLDLITYLLSYLWNKGTQLSDIVRASVVQLLCKVIKLGLLADEDYTESIASINKFTIGPVESRIIGLEILDQLVYEMNERYKNSSIAQHRKVAINFRDQSLLPIFSDAMNALFSLNESSAQFPLSPLDDKLLDKTLSVVIKCLNFDFIGTSLSESSEDLSTLQVPTNWRDFFEGGKYLVMLFELYSKCRVNPRSSQILEVLSLMTSVKGSMFSNQTRGEYLDTLVLGCIDILDQQIGLDEEPNHHQFCRVLARMKANYQLKFIVMTSRYEHWIKLLAQFTCKTFYSWQFSPNSVFYLLTLWSKMVSALSNLKADAPTYVEDYAPKILTDFVLSRLSSIPTILENPDLYDDPLADEEMLREQLDTIPYIARCKYPEVTESLIQIFDPLAAQFQQYCQSDTTVPNNVLDGQLAWLVYIIGAITGGKVTMSLADHNALDGELAARVFQLLTIHDQRLSKMEQSEQVTQLEQAFLMFIYHFRRVYVGDASVAGSKLYDRLSETLGIRNHQMVLELMVRKIGANLTHWLHNPVIIEKTLSMFQDLAIGYSSSKLLVKLDVINAILSDHTARTFPFLAVEENSRNRTIFYTTLSRMLYTNQNIEKFDEFMVPFAQSFEYLASKDTIESFRTLECKQILIGLMRDLRGVFTACQNRIIYERLFEWIYPKYTDLMAKAIGVWYANPEVTSPLLRCASQMATNVSGRLNFDCSSAYGILLFREISKILYAYGSRIHDEVPPAGEEYPLKYKGICLCITVLTRALCGNYVNFGVFELYGDPALSNALTVGLKLALSIPFDQLLTYPKLVTAYYTFLQVLCQHHLKYALELDSESFGRIIHSIQEGIGNIELAVFSESCTALDYIAEFYFKHRNKDTPVAQSLKSHIDSCRNVFANFLGLLFQVLLFVESANHWAMARPILSLILIDPDQYQALGEEITNTQPAEQRPKLVEAFTKLMSQVQNNLQPANREKFTQNLTQFRRDVRAFIVS